MNDLAGLSKPLTRLIEVISKGVGALSRPYLTRRMADAKAYEIKAISAALDAVAPTEKDDSILAIEEPLDRAIFLLQNTTTESRIEARLDHVERKRQNNIEKITSAAALELIDAHDIPEASPDEDWVSRFFTSAQDISSEQMQVLWGRILAGEVKKPGSYSLRTIDLVRNLSKSEAEVFQLVGKYAIRCEGVSFLYAGPGAHQPWIEREGRVYPAMKFLLDELGIMYPNELSYHVLKSETRTGFRLGDLWIQVERGESDHGIAFPIWKFTEIGAELLALLTHEIDDEYSRVFVNQFFRRKYKVSLGKVLLELANGMYKVGGLKSIEPDAGSD